MWWSDLRKIFACALLGLSLAACGFQPLYGARDSAAPNGRLAVDVAPIADRAGQVLRASLRREFALAAPPEYRMDVALSERIDTLAIEPGGDVIRRRLTVAARWRLTRLDADAAAEKPIDGTIRVDEAFNVLTSAFATLAAERAARERASERLARDIAIAATARARSG